MIMIMIITGPRRSRQERSMQLIAGWGATICAGWALVHLWWVFLGRPEYFSEESIFPDGWVPVAPAVVAAVTCAVIARTGHHRSVVAVPAALAGSVMIAYCMLAWISFLMILLVPFGVPTSPADIGLLVLRVSGAVGGGLAVWAAVASFQLSSPSCPDCGRAPTSWPSVTDWWGYVAGYLAVAGMVARAIVEVPHALAVGLEGPGGIGFKFFIVGMIIAGSLLPLALVHGWGRIWPGWVLPLAGRKVPRLLVLIPGVVMGAGLTVYFGIGGFGAMITDPTGLDLAGIVMIGGYTLWGLGLLAASYSYARATRPVCTCTGNRTPAADPALQPG